MCDHCNNQGLCKCDKEELQEQIDVLKKKMDDLSIIFANSIFKTKCSMNWKKSDKELPFNGSKVSVQLNDDEIVEAIYQQINNGIAWAFISNNEILKEPLHWAYATLVAQSLPYPVDVPVKATDNVPKYVAGAVTIARYPDIVNEVAVKAEILPS
jgi:hypothetical protein